MMIELASRINYLEDKLKDLCEKETVLKLEVKLLKERVLDLEDTQDTGVAVEDDTQNYGGSK